MPISYIKSPLNYTGGKYKILDSIIPLFPKKICNFVDLFAGGLNVGINVNAETIYVNDQISYLMDIYKLFQQTETSNLVSEIKERISRYHLSDTDNESFLDLRKKYNESNDPLDLFILTCYSFNHQIRFNSKHEFNAPFGKERSSFNNSIESNLISFCDSLKEKNFIFSTVDFRQFDFSSFSENDLVYCDPPYLISTGTYNDGKRGFNGWSEKDDFDLFSLLDKLNNQNVNFALSNVFYHKGRRNDALIEWGKKYIVTYIDKSYSNCSYNIKDKNSDTVEVLITNF